MKLGHVALDGTKVRANASRHKAMSYGRMKEKEAQLAGEVEELLRQAQEVDEEEDRRYGQSKRGDELPQELAFREGRLQKIREAMASLEAESQAAAEQAEAAGKGHSGVPDDKAQRNFTDTESRIMPAPGGRDFLQAYNCQAVVDSAHQVIVAAQATNQTSDKQQASAKEAKLVFMGHALMENRNGLLLDFVVSSATGTAERDAVPVMLDDAWQRGFRSIAAAVAIWFANTFSHSLNTRSEVMPRDLHS